MSGMIVARFHGNKLLCSFERVGSYRQRERETQALFSANFRPLKNLLYKSSLRRWYFPEATMALHFIARAVRRAIIGPQMNAEICDKTSTRSSLFFGSPKECARSVM